MTPKMNIQGIDVYIGSGASYPDVVRCISTFFGLPEEQIVKYDGPEDLDVIKHGSWAFIYKIVNSSRFSYKADIELYRDFDWEQALEATSRELGVEIVYPDEDHLSGDAMISVLPDGRTQKTGLNPEDLGDDL